MHCRACDRLLTEYQSTLKNAVTGQYMDLCKVCLEDIKPFVKLIDRKDLITEADLDTEPEDDLDTGLSLEDLDIHINYEVDYEDSRGSYDV
jgi:hypothetical protein